MYVSDFSDKTSRQCYILRTEQGLSVVYRYAQDRWRNAEFGVGRDSEETKMMYPY